MYLPVAEIYLVLVPSHLRAHEIRQILPLKDCSRCVNLAQHIDVFLFIVGEP